MDEFTTLFIMEENISWNGFLFSIMAFLFILGLFILYITDKSNNRTLSLSSISMFISMLIISFIASYIIYVGILAEQKLWTQYQKGDYSVITGKVDTYKVGYKSKQRYDEFTLEGITFYSIYASPNPTNFDDTIFYKNSDILEQNLTLRISYIKNVKGMIGNAIVKFEILKKEQ